MDMNCNQIRADVREKGLQADAGVIDHLDRCPLCRAWYADHRLAMALQALPVPEPSPGFVDRALRNAALGRPQRAPSAWLSAAAAILLTVAVALLALVSTPRSAELDTRIVNVVIEARDNRTNALVVIDLADDLELEGFAGERRIEWHTDLARGRNLLTLPVRSRSGRGGDIRVALHYDDGQRTEVRIPVRAG
jgi:hypothetical protein